MLQALRFNIVGSDESSSAFAAVRREVDQTKSAFNSIGPALAASSAAFRLNTFQMQNMAFQMNDIAVMLASGQSPFVLLMQQGMQIAQLFGPGVGVAAALRATGAALASFLLNPLTLTVVGFAAAAGAASMFFRTLSGGSSRIETDLKTHKELVDRITSAYVGADEAVKKYGRDSTTLLSFNLQQDIARLQRDLQSALAPLTQAQTMGARGPTGGGPLSWLTGGNEGILQLRKAVQDFQAQVRNGKVDLSAFNDQIARIAMSDPANSVLQTAAQRLIALGASASAVEAELKKDTALQQLLGFNAAGTTMPLTKGLSDAFDVGFADKASAIKSLADDLKALHPPPTKAENKITGVVESLQLQTENLQRTNREQAIYNALAQAGVDINSVAGKIVSMLAGGLFDQQQALSATISKLDEMRTAARDVFGTFVDDLRQGKSLVESLGDAFEHLADRLISSGLDSIVDSIFGKKGSATGAVGGIGAFIGSLFGFADGGSLIAGGAGGPDSQLLMAKVSPGERIDFTPRGKSRGGSGETHIVVHVDKSPYFDVAVERVAGPLASRISASTVSAAGSEQQREQMRSG
jgi:hypothetical protein